MKESQFAFPSVVTEDSYWEHGMTLRDYFAAKAMQGLVSPSNSFADTAHISYQIADAMLAERSKTNENG